MIPYGKQEITKEDIEEVVKVLQSDYLTQGPKVPMFEEGLQSYTGAKYAFAVNSATSALHISCLALGLKEGDWIWTSPITFVASANCGLYCGAQVDFVDINKDTYNLCSIKLEAKLKLAKISGTLPKILIPVHLTGQPCDMEAIKNLSDEYNFKIIEDASHAIGGNYQDTKIGSCKFSDVTVFSFHPVKIITTAEGGAALTNNKNIAKKINLLRTHGITRDESLLENKPHGGWYYEQLELGYNYRMTELQAALGVSQLARIDDFVSLRHKLAARYNNLLKEFPLVLPFQLENSYSGLHLYVIRLDLKNIQKTHKHVFEKLRENGIGVNLHYIPVYKHPFHASLISNENDFPESESYYKEAISLPMFHTMTFKEQDIVVETLSLILKK